MQAHMHTSGIAVRPAMRARIRAGLRGATASLPIAFRGGHVGRHLWSRALQQFKNLGASGAAASGSQSKLGGALGKSLRMAPQRAPGDGRGRPGAGGGRKAGLVWFRGDLRLHDHEALSKATAECTSLLPVYCFDPRDFRKSPQGYDRTGPYRAQFLLEAVADLRERLRRAGSELVVRLGRPEEVLASLVRRTGAAAVYCHSEVTYEAKQVEGLVKSAVEGEGAQLQMFWANTLHHPQDLPFRLQDLPQNFDQFRERTAGVAARAALAEPQQLRGLPAGPKVEPGDVPTLKQLGLAPPPRSAADAKPTGGETEALRQLRTFLAQAQGGGSGGAPPARGTGAACGSNFANNIAPWLAAGCLSPRHMYDEARRLLGGAGAGADAGTTAPASTATVTQQGAQRGGVDPMHWVSFELLWRDFFRFITAKYAGAAVSGATAAARRNTAGSLAMA